MGKLIGWTERQVEDYKSLRARVLLGASQNPASTPRSIGGRNWQILEAQSGDVDGDGYYPGWWVQGERFVERVAEVRIESLDGRRLSPGRFYVGYLLRHEDNEASVWMVASDGPLFAVITEIRDQSPTWIEYGWDIQVPAIGGGYTSGSGEGHVRGSIRIKTIQNGDDVASHEIHAVAIMGATGGTFTLTVDNGTDIETTAGIAHDIDAAGLEAALEALPNLTDVSVSGSGTYTSPFLIEYLDFFDNIPALTGDYEGLAPEVARYPAFERGNKLVKPGTAVLLWPGAGERPYVHSIVEQRGDGDTLRTIYHVWLTGAAYGTYTLVFEEQTTAAIAFDADAAAVESALEALSNLTNVSVTGTGSLGDPFVITILDDYAPHGQLGRGIDNLIGTLDYRFEADSFPDDALDVEVVTSAVWDEAQCDFTEVKQTLREIIAAVV